MTEFYRYSRAEYDPDYLLNKFDDKPFIIKSSDGEFTQCWWDDKGKLVKTRYINEIEDEMSRWKLEAKVKTLFDAIKHGDERHQLWLKEAINKHFAGEIF